MSSTEHIDSRNKPEPLYPNLGSVSRFVESCADDGYEDRIPYAIARYVAEMPGKDFFDARKDWMAFAEGRPVERD